MLDTRNHSKGLRYLNLSRLSLCPLQLIKKRRRMLPKKAIAVPAGRNIEKTSKSV
jgi:hypothetical protein